ncbi:Symplekin [Thalictrum thalictroides]|uniref:Symplekin n=1 Tax=Thalictrum thalictroides TaxID=46969 RepID=A0A7J6W969_THATH|nr:Symplekin [Thalictrum thalictroides]
MVGIMAARSREEAASLLHSIKFSTDTPSKLEYLHQLKDILLQRNPSLLTEFVPLIIELQNDQSSPVRKTLAEMIGEIGVAHPDFIPEMLQVLIDFFEDGTPAVTRQAITSGTNLFRATLEKVAVQGLHSSGLDESLELAWNWMLKFKDTLYPIAFQPGSDGIRLLAVKFVEGMILLYTPDPDCSTESQPHEASDGQTLGFDISWLRGGHPLLNAGDLSVEASQSLGLLVDQLRFPKVKSLSNSMIVVLIKSLSAIAKKRPAFYGRILPVLLGLDPPMSVIKGVRFAGVHHTLRNAFLSCLTCTNPGAAPWRNRLVSALKELKAEDLADQAVQALKTSGSMEDGAGEAYLVKEEKSFVNACDAVEVDPRKKRPLVQSISDLLEDNDLSGKRSRPTALVSEQSDGVTSPNLSHGSLPAVGSTSSGKGDTVQQLGAMFGALVAQGDKASGSLEILISSISADLLAEVVMANMQYLPLISPKAEEDGDSAILNSNSSMGGVSTHPTQPFSLLSEVASLFSGFPQIAPLLDAQAARLHDVPKQNLQAEKPAMTVLEIGVDCDSASNAAEAVTSINVSPPSDINVPSVKENGNSAFQVEMHDVGTLDYGIPGLDSIHSGGSPESLDASDLASGGLPELSQDQITGLDPLVSVSYEAMPADRSEEISLNETVSDVNSVSSTTTTSAVVSSQFVLPKMSAPVVNLTDDQKDDIQRAAFIRIIENYSRISVSGGSHLRFSLLACLGVEYPLELDPWKLLQKHILSDYLNHEGHELTIRVLYRLYRESEQEQDFFASTTATSVYESFLLIVAETLRDSFPASDKSLSRLLGEVPCIPKSAFNLLESLCSPGHSEKTDKELQNGDRVTQGLSAVWSLILLRPPIRDVCLKIALQSSVHHMEEVRMKAIRLVANKLYPISSITRQIENFATEMLLSVENSGVTEGMDVQESTMEVQKDSDLEKPTNEQLLASTAPKEIASDTRLSSSSPSTSSSSISEAQRRMSLYFALCTKKHSLFHKVFVIYNSIPEAVKQAVHRQIPILVRTIGTSSELLAIISDPPTGSENLLTQVLNILTDGTIPSPDLISTVRKLFHSKIKDVEVLIPVLSLLQKDEVLSIFPQLVNLPLDKFQAALSRLLQESSHFGPVLTPTEVLIAVHGIDPERDGIPLKKVTDACNACFEQRQVFTQQVIAIVLNQLVEQIPLPLLFMRTVLQAIGAFPSLVDFIMEILSRLVTKQIWKYPKLWVGFLKCALLTKPQSFSVLLQLPAAQLENVLNRTAALKPPLVAHANQPNVRSSLPRSTLVVLGIASDSQISSQAQSTPSQAQSTPSQTAENSASAAEGMTEKTKESSIAS